MVFSRRQKLDAALFVLRWGRNTLSFVAVYADLHADLIFATAHQGTQGSVKTAYTLTQLDVYCWGNGWKYGISTAKLITKTAISAIRSIYSGLM